MKFKVFNINIVDPEPDEHELNRFMAQHTILEAVPVFTEAALVPQWTVCVMYLESQESDEMDQPRPKRKKKVDYREILDEESFSRFSMLRKVRKSIADDQGLPAFAVMTNEQMADLAKQPEISLKTLGALKGVGQGKLDRFGNDLIKKFRAIALKEPATRETSETRVSDPPELSSARDDHNSQDLDDREDRGNRGDDL